MTRWQRLAAGIGVLVIAVWPADSFELIKLIADGHGWITWGFWLFLLLPVLIFGTRTLIRDRK